MTDRRQPHPVDPATRVGIVGFEIDPRAGQFRFVGARSELFGYPADRWAKPGFLESIIHPHDQERVLADRGKQPGSPLGSRAQRYRIRAHDGRVVWIEERRTVPSTSIESVAGVLIDVTADQTASDAIDHLTMAVEGQLGEAFFERLVTTVSTQLGTRCAMVGEISGPDRDRVTTVALSIGGDLVPAITYSLIGAPCAEPALGRRLVIPEGAGTQYPACPIIQSLDGVGYVGVPVYGAGTNPIGVLVVVHDRPLVDAAEIERLLKAIGPRTGAELERRRAEEQRASLQNQLVEAQKMEALGTLAGGIAHDFNNILMGILGNTEMAQDELETWHPASQNLLEIRRAAHRARDLVQRILTFGRKREPVRQTLAIRTVVDDVVLLLRASLPSTIDIVVEHGELPNAINADASQIHQVLMNLASNAAHAIGHRPGRITIRDSLVDLPVDSLRAPVAAAPGRYLRVAVTDSGVGMDKETLARAFEPFFTTKAPGEGTGLGLAVAHGIMQEHGGAIAATSTVGVGTTFDLFFPVVSGECPDALNHDEAFPAGTGQHILIVDDEAAIVRVTCRMLERLGYRVSSFYEAPAALAALEASPTEYHMVISDLTMPEVTGLDLAERVRRIRPTIPIVLTSGHPEMGGDARIGIVDYVLTKPFTSSALAQAVHRLMTPHDASAMSR